MAFRKVLLGLILALCVILVYARVGAPNQPAGTNTSSSAPAEGQSTGDVPARPATEIGIDTGKGVVLLSQQRGKVVLLDFWATWCGPCRMSIPAVERLYAKHQASGFQVLGVSMDREPSVIAPFAQEMGITYPVGQPDSPERVGNYATGGIPLMVLVDRKGQVRWMQEGYGEETESELSRRVESLLAEGA